MTDVILSTGCYSRVMKHDLNDIILRILTHEVVGVEASFLNVEEILNYTPSEKVISSLKGKYNTLHAPTKNISYSNNDECVKVLGSIRRLYKDLNCRKVTFHYETLSDIGFVSGYLSGLNLNVENSNKAKPFFADEKGIESFFNSHNNFGMTLDICHALEFSKEYLRRLVDKFSDRITEVHWSYSGHSMNHDSASSIISDIKFGLGIVKELGAKTVLEVDLRPNLENRNVISSEIELLKNGL